MEIYDDAFDRRDHIQSLIDQYEEIMDEIDVIGREAKDKVYSKDVFGRGKSLITDVSRILEVFYFRWLRIKGIYATFPITIALFSNHLKQSPSYF